MPTLFFVTDCQDNKIYFPHLVFDVSDVPFDRCKYITVSGFADIMSYFIRYNKQVSDDVLADIREQCAIYGDVSQERVITI